MWKPMGDSTGQCCTSLESTGYHIMRGGLRPPTQQGGRRLRRRPPCWVSHYVVPCGFQRGAALASAVPHWFPHVRLNIPTWVAFSDIPMSHPLYPYGYTHGQWDIRENHSAILLGRGGAGHGGHSLRPQVPRFSSSLEFSPDASRTGEVASKFR